MLAVEPTSLEALSPPATGREDNNHCTSGRCSTRAVVLGVRLSARPFSCRVIQVQIDLLFGLNLHTIL